MPIIKLPAIGAIEMPMILEADTQAELLAAIKEWLLNEGERKRALAASKPSQRRRDNEIVAASALEIAGNLIGEAVIRNKSKCPA